MSEWFVDRVRGNDKIVLCKLELMWTCLGEKTQKYCIIVMSIDILS